MIDQEAQAGDGGEGEAQSLQSPHEEEDGHGAREAEADGGEEADQETGLPDQVLVAACATEESAERGAEEGDEGKDGKDEAGGLVRLFVVDLEVVLEEGRGAPQGDVVEDIGGKDQGAEEIEGFLDGRRYVWRGGRGRGRAEEGRARVVGGGGA